MVDIINYIRNIIFPQPETRKRSRSVLEDYEIPISPKIRKISASQMSSPLEDDWHSTSSSTSIKRRSALHNTPSPGVKQKSSWAKENNVTVTIDDDDDILEISKIKPRSWVLDPVKATGRTHYTSTPNDNQRVASQRNGDDIIFLKSTQTAEERKMNAKKQGFDYIKPFSYLSDNQNKRRSIIQNGTSHTRDYTSPIFSSVREIKSKLGLNKRPTIRSTLLDQSFRLDEKAKYKRLLSQAATSNALRDSFSKYNTPVGKLFTGANLCRGKKLANMGCLKDKPMSIVDLTNGNGSDKEKPRLTTKETIKKVLDEFDNEPMTVKDSDSDVEILPTPPSPKPDIQVERVNSLKKVVDTKEHTHNGWLTKMVQKHRDDIAKYEREIRTQTEQTEKLRAVTSEVCAQRLENQMVKCLHIKDAVLPVLVPEEPAFPELTEDDEDRINAALSRRGSPNEVVASKFNLNITRRDIQTLAGLNWLNDEVINFYMNMLIERGKDSKWPKAYAMNTFFYPKLTKDGPSSLRRWTRRVDIFAHDIIAVPIHLGVHWCMSIIDFRSKTIRYYDSMGSANRQCLEALLNYLQAEHLDKKQTEYDTSGWALESTHNIPQQMNGSDCGMFACTFAEFLCRNAKITFSQEDMPYLRRKMVLEILNGELLIN